MLSADTPRRRVQFRRLDREGRRAALKTLFTELDANSLGKRLAVVRRIEQIWYSHKHLRPKPAYYKIPRERARAMSKHWAALAVLETNPVRKADHDAQARRYKVMARAPRKIEGRKKDGLDWLVADLASYYTERTSRRPGVSNPSDGKGPPSGPFLRVVASTCALIGLDTTPHAIGTVIKHMGKMSRAAG